MSTATLYGKLTSAVAVDYERSIAAFKQAQVAINRFGEVAAEFDLIANVVPKKDESVRLNATTLRGRNHEQLFAALEIQGYHVGEPVKAPQQFTDGWVMWTVVVKSHNLEFNLLYYTAVEAA